MSKIERRDTNSRMSKSVSYGDLVFLAGQVGDAKSVGVEAQTREVLAKIDAALIEVGSDKSKLLSALIHLKSMSDFAAMNGVWESWVSAGNPPARTTVQALLAHPDLVVEITVVAAR
jgi:enamine deaminase RidA (YjgF/YER057c/UK114 family)